MISASAGGDLSGLSMEELFRMEAEAQTAILTDGLLAIEREPDAREWLDALMRAAHSLKGAARLSGNEAVVRVAHAMEDVFEAARQGILTLTGAHVDVLFQGVDLIARLAQTSLEPGSIAAKAAEGDTNAFLAALAAPQVRTAEPLPTPTSAASSPPQDTTSQAAIRVTAEHFNRLLGLAGESVVLSRWVTSFVAELARLRHLQNATTRLLNDARDQAAATGDPQTRASLEHVYTSAMECQAALSRCLTELDTFDRRSLSVSHRLYEGVLAARMRPFSDGVHKLPRMVRDLAQTLGKRVQFSIDGEQTPVDRDILQRLETPIVHLLRNVLDHGIETPEERHKAGKPEEGHISLTAKHNAGKLTVIVADDGRGVDPESIRCRVVEQGLTTADVAAKLNTTELLEFLFLPGFSTRKTVTEISGRGVGLDIVMTMVREVGGTAEIASRPGEGMRVQLQLPLTLSVVRALIVEIGGEAYALPLTRIAKVVRVPRASVHSAEGHEHTLIDERPVGLVSAQHILDVTTSVPPSDTLLVVVLGDKTARYGLVVDRLMGERELVVRPLDKRLGKVADVSAAALLPDETPVLILDPDDLIRSIEIAVSGGRLAPVGMASTSTTPTVTRRRVLVVDDSITVRETERKLLESAGYDVDIAVDGMDGWNAIRSGHYDLVVTDVDMPRLTGIELTTMIRKDAKLKGLPVMIVSYKDREEDRLRGLDAGADYYLTKASFHDDTLLHAAADLIGEGVVQG